MNWKEIVAWFGKHKKVIAGTLVILAILTIAFWYGGGTKDSRGFGIHNNVADNGEASLSKGNSLESSNRDQMIQNTNSDQDATANQGDAVNDQDSEYAAEMENQNDLSDGQNNDQNNGNQSDHDQQDSGQSDNEQGGSGQGDKQSGGQGQGTVGTDGTEKSDSCTFSISCATILNHMGELNSDKKELIPSDGWILSPMKVEISSGESVFDILSRVCRGQRIPVESSWTPLYNSAYIEGINNLYEFDCGSLSGWMFRLNGQVKDYGSTGITVHNGDVIEWVYTCNLGKDI